MSETERLRAMLDAMGVPWRGHDGDGKERTAYRGRDGTVSAICGPRTDCGALGLLEAWAAGQPHEGGLMADEVIERFAPDAA